MSNEVTKKTQAEVPMVSELGDGSVFVKKTATGFVKAVRANVVLAQDSGHLYQISGKTSITYAGYEHMNKIAGVSVITPETLRLPNGQVVVNPYPMTDPETGSIERVWVRKSAVGYGPTGNLVITSRTLLYDIKQYFIQDLLKKVKNSKKAGRIAMKQAMSNEDYKTGIVVDVGHGLVIWADPENAEVIKSLETYIQNKLFAERKAQTICERNALKSHPALSQGTKINAQQGKAKVRVIGWVSDFTEAELDELRKRAEAVELVQDNIKVLDHEVQIDDEYHQVDNEDLLEPIDEPDDGVVEDIGEQEPLEAVEPDTTNLDIMYDEYVEVHGAVKVEKVIKQNFGGKKWKDLDHIEKATGISRLSRELN